MPLRGAPRLSVEELKQMTAQRMRTGNASGQIDASYVPKKALVPPQMRYASATHVHSVGSISAPSSTMSSNPYSGANQPESRMQERSMPILIHGGGGYSQAHSTLARPPQVVQLEVVRNPAGNSYAQQKQQQQISQPLSAPPQGMSVEALKELTRRRLEASGGPRGGGRSGSPSLARPQQQVMLEMGGGESSTNPYSAQLIMKQQQLQQKRPPALTPSLFQFPYTGSAETASANSYTTGTTSDSNATGLHFDSDGRPEFRPASSSIANTSTSQISSFASDTIPTFANDTSKLLHGIYSYADDPRNEYSGKVDLLVYPQTSPMSPTVKSRRSSSVGDDDLLALCMGEALGPYADPASPKSKGFQDGADTELEISNGATSSTEGDVMYRAKWGM